MRRGKEDAPVGGGKTAVGRGGASGTAEGRRNKTAPEWQSTQKVTQQNMDTLDFSVRNGGGGGADAGGHADNYGADGDEESEEEEDGAGEDKGQSGVFSSMVGKIWALAGGCVCPRCCVRSPDAHRSATRQQLTPGSALLLSREPPTAY
eukprot:GHVU01108484.1.p1 GENE.GHVU01108484.1~~GHVU01108484.1.p1  ORF type:complete len:149 (+),score=28.87 GHVU01108484.1:713-1159(+)